MTPEEMLRKCAETCYSEPESDIHNRLTEMAWERVRPMLEPGANILDVGAGSGVGLKRFAVDQFKCVGLNLHLADVEACHANHVACIKGDMHDIPIVSLTFSLVWARHVLEHSPFPMLALAEIHRILDPGGLLYAEVPDPATPCAHWSNPNHWSCFTREAWQQLFLRAGFEPVDSWEFTFNVAAGDDRYFGWIWRKK